jgi:hypothetical protein
MECPCYVCQSDLVKIAPCQTSKDASNEPAYLR